MFLQGLFMMLDIATSSLKSSLFTDVKNTFLSFLGHLLCPLCGYTVDCHPSQAMIM